jgi:hypothetical protein
MLTAFVCLSIISTKAQIREVPKEVEHTFTRQYPEAHSATYQDHLLNVRVHFVQNGETFQATYTNKGLWKETEKEITFEQVSADVKDGFEKSKYADWKVVETRALYRPNNVELYRIKVEKNELQKKNLLFNTKGRLIEEGITL